MKENNVKYVISLELKKYDIPASIFSFIKRFVPINSSIPITRQINMTVVTELKEEDSFTSLASSTLPLMKFLADEKLREMKKLDDGARQKFQTITKTIAELDMILLQLEENVYIPSVNFTIHPKVLQILKKCKEENRSPNQDDFLNLTEDSAFLNQLQRMVVKWINDIKKVTTSDYQIESGTTISEVMFWMKMEQIINGIEKEMNSSKIQLTLNILKHGKRFHITVSFESDTGLSKALEKAQNYNRLLKELPLQQLLTATDLPKITEAIKNIFVHLKNVRHGDYPLSRSNLLIECISRDFNRQIIRVLSTFNLLQLDYKEFDEIMKQCISMFNEWTNGYEKIHLLLRELLKKRRDNQIRSAWNKKLPHTALQNRLDGIAKFRSDHEQLRIVITRVIRVDTNELNENNSNENNQSPYSINSEVIEAYEELKGINYLDLKKENEADEWEKAMEKYDSKIKKVELKITETLQILLKRAKSTMEMVSIFTRFNAFLVRSNINEALYTFQTPIINSVIEECGALHQRFIKGCTNVQRIGLKNSRPVIVNRIIWSRTFDDNLNEFEKIAAGVLGVEWEEHSDGKKLKKFIDNFRQQLCCNNIIQKWKDSYTDKDFEMKGLIFMVSSSRELNGNIIYNNIEINSNDDALTRAEEITTLRSYGIRVILSKVNKAYQTLQLQPCINTLKEAIKTYNRTFKRVNIVEMDEKMDVKCLIDSLNFEIQKVFLDGSEIEWGSFRVPQYVQKLSESVLTYKTKTQELLDLKKTIVTEVNKLKMCKYDEIEFVSIMKNIQKNVEQLSFKQYSNVSYWVKTLNDHIEELLTMRLIAAIHSWTEQLHLMAVQSVKSGKGGKCLLTENELKDIVSRPYEEVFSLEEDIVDGNTLRYFGDEFNEENGNNEENLETWKLLGGQPTISSCHEIKVKNKRFKLIPSLEITEEILLHQFRQHTSVIGGLKKIVDSTDSDLIQSSHDFNDIHLLFSSFMCDNDDVIKGEILVLEKIKLLIEEIKEYIGTWTNYLSMWLLEPDTLFNQLGDDLDKWMNCLTNMKEDMVKFDCHDSYYTFGPVKISFGKIQTKIFMKYNAWHKKVLSNFGVLLSKNMKDFYSLIKDNREELEKQSIEASDINGVFSIISNVEQLKVNLKEWRKEADLMGKSETLMEKHRYTFPSEWLYMECIEGEWSALNEILNRRDTVIQEQKEPLRHQIKDADLKLQNKMKKLLVNWKDNKPIDGMQPKDALTVLNDYEKLLSECNTQHVNLVKGKALLNVDHSSSQKSTTDMTNAIEELTDLKNVWESLQKFYERLEEIGETSWMTVHARKLKGNLESILLELKGLPINFREYDSYSSLKNRLQSYVRMNLLITDLKSGSLKPRHWDELVKKMNVDWQLNDLILQQVWDVNLIKYEPIIKEIMTTAQGEKALEEFLRQVIDCWKSYTLELINYQNRCSIIRGWDDLFNKVKEHINSLTAMKLSPYYKEFENETIIWDDKLNKINSLFDVWIDVQRRWVYLDGIFSSSADIQHLLPRETQRFQNISTDFLSLMKKVAKGPNVMDVIAIVDVQRTLDRLADWLRKIQKALGDYLERERSNFPRFYFVGDEDLLEIIGNSKNIPRLQKHFRKMFAGIHSILLSDDCKKINGISSKEGEQIVFAQPILIEKFPRINQWLSELEKNMRMNLAIILSYAINDINEWMLEDSIDHKKFFVWLDKYQAQIVVLAVQVAFSSNVDKALDESNKENNELNRTLQNVKNALNVLADSVLNEQPILRRKKLEHLILEYVHQQDVVHDLIKENVKSSSDFSWLSQMRFYFDPSVKDVLQQLSIQIADAKFCYGFEYLGVQEKLVQTPLTDRCYLTMTQALQARLGGSPFGPAGTGKTESVKALGNQFGRFVLVFNCDETFDFQAMGRIFVGLCQVGAWGCFDEFNRLEERMLSAVSQQIQTIQEALRTAMNNKEELNRSTSSSSSSSSAIQIELVGKQVRVNPDMAIFITMNPGYAGRSNLPDNLKKLFRSLAMTAPDKVLIAQVMLYSQGFRLAAMLAKKVVPFFRLCDEQLSSQSHYDFGLRALKSVLVMAGNVKRTRLKELMKDIENIENKENISERIDEQEILIQSVMESFVPRLVADDLPLLHSLLGDVFPGVEYMRADLNELRKHIEDVCNERFLISADPDSIDIPGAKWTEKILQLYQITQLNHGLMLVGPSGSGKTCAWKALIEALRRYEGIDGCSYVIDPKAISKDNLYGFMDQNTREWTDGIFTHILRKIIDNVRGELNKRQWIIFDGDVDPEWVENLNSVLDDNKLLTLPNGERLSLPPNVRIMFEVQDLKYATLATVSRCGMVWFSEDTVDLNMLCEEYLGRLRSIPIESINDNFNNNKNNNNNLKKNDENENIDSSNTIQLQRECAGIYEPFFKSNGILVKALEYSKEKVLNHIMDFTEQRALNSFFSLLNQSVRNIIQYNEQHDEYPLSSQCMTEYLSKYFVIAMIWSFTGDSVLKSRYELGEYLRTILTIDLPSNSDGESIIDYEVEIQSGKWLPWSRRVPQIEIETHRIDAPDVVIPTIDTVRHETLLYTWLHEHKPLLLCGPPGSGKTMTLFSALRALPDMEVIGLNFSSATTPELMLKTFDHYCEYRKTPNGLVLAPQHATKWIVLFCDEINLPDEDKYGTQRIISFIRQLVESGGFYRTSDHSWVTLERIQFVGACNPPTDPGRKPLSHRFLRHVPIVYVDYPGKTSLQQIYGTFNRAILRLQPSIKSFAELLTCAMVDLFLESQERFTVDMQPHYIYSPREMTRWFRGIYEAIRPLNDVNGEGLVRLWAHEALRLFQDRLVHEEERRWTDEKIEEIAKKYFGMKVNLDEALKRPILFSNWLQRNYVSVNANELKNYAQARLKTFYEEELDQPLVLFDEMIDHALRIDRIYRQQQGHLLLIGVSGSGKTTLSRFVAWLNNLTVFQIKIHNKYTMEDFDEDLRNILRRAGCKKEKIAFILDESNVLDSSFLERMNTLLANGEVPGLFENDEYTTLMSQCKEGAAKDGQLIDSNDELYKWFTNQVIRNLHVVFTMNPSDDGLKDRAATSPALFNRCVLNWYGDWSNGALYEVGKEFTNSMELDRNDFVQPQSIQLVVPELSPMNLSHRQAVLNSFVFIHQSLREANNRAVRKGSHSTAITPRHFLDFINHFVKLYSEKVSELTDEKIHLNVGLKKLLDTVADVENLQKTLSVKRIELEKKNDLAAAKLKEMLRGQKEAEEKKNHSTTLSEKIAIDQEEIKVTKAQVMEQLDKVEPAVRAAEQAVQGIERRNLVEIRSLSSPPALVKMTLESVCLIIGEETTDWKMIRGILKRDNFISAILNFDTDTINKQMVDKFTKLYLSNPNYIFEKVNRASSACGPLVLWARAQIEYSQMLNKVEPLRKELNDLKEAAKHNTEQARDLKILIGELEKKISSYEKEYATLIGDAQKITSELGTVQTKVSRSVALLQSLSSERTRWEEGSARFDSLMNTIIGDVLLSSAFMAYAGYYDQWTRETLMNTWEIELSQSNILYREDIARIEYLSTADERMNWKECSLPSDNLCVENAIMLKRFNRYPLVIDPSGQATEFIKQNYEKKNLIVTSFLNVSFKKHLESALRFGNALLALNVESYDPILNPVLNRELRKAGGRTLITIGDQEIDFSPSFTIFLATRDPTIQFPPDLCSRVTFVNFTVTRASLQTQCENELLKNERPDVDKKRTDLMKVQGEFQQKLRHLEKNLLQALNESKGNILDDDSIISKLEYLKTEAADVTKKIEESDSVMVEVDEVAKEYAPLAQASAAIYFTMEAMSQIHYLYHYALQFFLSIFNEVISNNKNLEGITNSKDRLNIIRVDLFRYIYCRVSRGMLHNDCIVFALLLSKIFIRHTHSNDMMNLEFNHLLRGTQDTTLASIQQNKKNSMFDRIGKVAPQLTEQQRLCATKLSMSFKQFQNLDNSLKDKEILNKWLDDESPESSIPPNMFWKDEENKSIKICMNILLLIQAFRPDRLIAACHQFVLSVFGKKFFTEAEAVLNLNEITENEVTAITPILLCSVPGYDASGRIEDMAIEKNKRLTSIAIGSSEGFTQAKDAISSAAQSGRWVLLKNVHLAPQWITEMQKDLNNLTINPNFRIFMSLEMSPNFPANVIRSSRVLVFEPPPGIKANLQRTFAAFSSNRIQKNPNIRSKLYFLLAWLHAIVQERLRYSPLGWSKIYEFNESDLRSAADTIDRWIDNIAGTKSNLPIEKVPWEAIRTLLSKCIYGGRIDNMFDQRLLDAFLHKLFDIQTFNDKFKLIDDLDINLPEKVSYDLMESWCEKLPNNQTPSWLGLPNNAQRVLLTNLGHEATTKVLKMQVIIDEDTLAYQPEASDDGDKKLAEGRPAWMIQVGKLVTVWLKQLPKNITPVKRTTEGIRDPLFRFFEREITQGHNLLEIVRKNLSAVLLVCTDEKEKQTNEIRNLLTDLSKGIIPNNWKKYVTPKILTVIQWIGDFAQRVNQLSTISNEISKKGLKCLRFQKVWIGGLFTPEAYITATRQSIAQNNQWSLEELDMLIHTTDSN
ncbi:hypothetical protein SNEBB_011029, partial [Seison nebaliae]